jgi:competence ComEA-like helix-hairpin-helix protein
MFSSSSTYNKINWITFTWFIVTMALFALSFSKYSTNSTQPYNQNERHLISRILAAKPININTATEHDFSKLRGIGGQRAKKIVAYRAKHGRFKQLADIKQVPGLGERFFDENKELLTLD